MANISEYIVRINGDPSPLEKAVREAEQNMERIGKHEWKIRVNTDDAEAQIQPLLKLTSDLQLKSDIDLNVARQHDLEDQLELLEKIDKIRNKKPKDQFSGFSEEAYNLAGEVLDKMEAYEEAKAKRQKTNRRDAYYQSAVEEEVKAEREAARAARKLDYFEALFNDKSGGLTSDQRRKIRGVIQEGQEEARKQVERVNKDGRKEKVDALDYGNFEDGSVFDAEEIYKNTKKGLGKQIQAVKENRADLEKEYKRSKINPYKFREYDDGRGDPKERQRVIDENQKKQANKTVKDVLKENEKLTRAQEQSLARQREAQSMDYSYLTDPYERGRDSIEEYTEEVNKSHDSVSKMKVDIDEAQSKEADKQIESLRKERKMVQDELGLLSQKKITRKNIDDDRIFNVKGYKTKRNGEVEEVDYGKYSGKDFKEQILPKGYRFDKETGRWVSKGGTKAFSIDSQGKSSLEKWQKRVQDKQKELSDIDSKIEDVQSQKREKELQSLRQRFNEEARRSRESQANTETPKYDALKDDHDYTASQREGDTESERQFIELLHEEAEADEKAALARKNLESQKTVDDALVQTQKREQELARKYNKQLYESKGVTPTSDEYDSYYDSGVMERYEEQVEEARKAREKLNESMREGQSQADSTAEHTENLERDTQAAKKNAEANEEAARARGRVASGDAKGATDAQDAYKRRGSEANVADEEMSAEDILKRTEAIKEEGEKIKAHAKEYEEDIIQAVSYYDSANNLVKLQIKTRKLVPDEEGSNRGRIDTRTYTTNFDQESGGSFTSHITDTKFVDNIQKQAKAQKILTQNIDESSRALERFIAEQKELGTSFNADKVKSLREGLGNIYDQQDLRIWKNEYKAFREEIEASQKASKRSKGQQLSDADISNKNAIRAKNLDEFNSQVQKSSAVTDEFKAKVKELYATLSSAGKSPVLLEDFDKQLKKYQADFKKAESSSRANNEKANTRMSGYVDRLNSWNEDKYVDSVKNKIIGLRTELAELSGGTGKFNLDLNDENVRAQVERIDASMKELKASVKDTDNVLASGISISKLNEQMAQFVSKNHKLTNEYRQDIRELRQELENGGLTKTGFWDDARKNYTRGFDDVLKDFKNLQTRATDEGLVGGVGAFENLGNRVKQMSTNFVAMYFSLYDIVRYARELGQTVTEINSAQTELRKVSDASQTRIQENFKKSAETAQEMGATITDVISSTSDWARLGYSVDDAETLARNTALYQSVGDNMTQESASEYLTSIMKGYQLDADQSESIIDKVNEVANNYSIDTQGKIYYALVA